jgi:hypothetical protein
VYLLTGKRLDFFAVIDCVDLISRRIEQREFVSVLNALQGAVFGIGRRPLLSSCSRDNAFGRTFLSMIFAVKAGALLGSAS